MRPLQGRSAYVYVLSYSDGTPSGFLFVDTDWSFRTAGGESQFMHATWIKGMVKPATLVWILPQKRRTNYTNTVTQCVRDSSVKPTAMRYEWRGLVTDGPARRDTPII
jgi:hypothetical protein